MPCLPAANRSSMNFSTSFCRRIRFSKQPESFLRRADRDIGAGRVAQQGHQHVVVVVDAGVQRIARRTNRTAKSPPEVEFPTEVEAKTPLAEELVGQAKPHEVAAHGLVLRKKVPSPRCATGPAPPARESRPRAKSGFADRPRPSGC